MTGHKSTAAVFGSYLSDLLTGAWGIVGDVLTAVSIAAFAFRGLESLSVVLLGAVAIAFIGSGFKIYQRHLAIREDQQRGHEAERADLLSEIDRLKRPRFSAETRQVAEAAYRALDRTQKVALRYLLVAGDMTDRQALDHLHTKGMATNYGSIFSALSEQTPFLQRVSPYTGRARTLAYDGAYTISPMFRDVISELVDSDPESKA